MFWQSGIFIKSIINRPYCTRTFKFPLNRVFQCIQISNIRSWLILGGIHIGFLRWNNKKTMQCFKEESYVYSSDLPNLPDKGFVTRTTYIFFDFLCCTLLSIYQFWPSLLCKRGRPLAWRETLQATYHLETSELIFLLEKVRGVSWVSYFLAKSLGLWDVFLTK